MSKLRSKGDFPWRWFGPGLPSGYSSEGQEGVYFKAALYTPMSHWITIG